MIIEHWKSTDANLFSTDILFVGGWTELEFCYFNDDILTVDKQRQVKATLEWDILLDVEVRFR